MKKLPAIFVFTIALLVFPTVARAQYTTYTPPWNPTGPDVTQAIIEKNMVRDRLRKSAKKGNKAVYDPVRKTAAKNPPLKKPVPENLLSERLGAAELPKTIFKGEPLSKAPGFTHYFN